MTVEDIVSQTEDILNEPQDFDVFAYIAEQPLSENEVTIATNGKAVAELDTLLTKRDAELAQRKAADKETGGGGGDTLSIADADADTEYDDAINELLDTVEKTALIFELKSLAPSMTKAIRKSYIAKKSALKNKEEEEAHDERMEADILRRTIVAVRTGDGSQRSTKEWTIEDILELDKQFHPEQSAKLIAEMYNIVYMGDAFDKALTPDFS